MEKRIETRNGHFETFEVIPINCKIGDTIYFDDDGSFLEGVVESIEPDHWWIYDDGTKRYGSVTVKCTTKESYYFGQNFCIDSVDILYEKPSGYDEYWSVDNDENEQMNSISDEFSQYINGLMESGKIKLVEKEKIQSFIDKLK